MKLSLALLHSSKLQPASRFQKSPVEAFSATLGSIKRFGSLRAADVSQKQTFMKES